MTSAGLLCESVCMPRILIVDDDDQVRALLAEFFGSQGFEVVTAEDGQVALERMRLDRPPVVLLDLNMPRLGGLEALPELKRITPQACVIILTSHSDVPTAVQAMRLGAYDYLVKPFDLDDLALRVQRALEHTGLLARVEELSAEAGAGGALRRQMGPSDAVAGVIRQVLQVAESNFSVLILGETGTGKELVARAIHGQSPRRERPFVALDCGAVPETLIESELFGFERGAFTGADRRKDGYFQAAEGGSLFLDEIGNLPLATQAKLLRALQERQVQALGATRPVPVDVRILAASNAPLESQARAGRFRQDLYYRLNEFTIPLPPLRGRREDIVFLARRFLDEASMELRRPVHRISEAASELLLRHPWPGNARELRNAIRQAVLLSDGLLLPEHLRLGVAEGGRDEAVPGPSSDLGSRSLRDLGALGAAEAERRAIRLALGVTRGNKSEAARLLKTDYKTLHLKMRRYGISGADFKAS